MARGKPHDPNIRAQVVAAVIAGATLPETARRFGISLGTVKGWWSEDRPVEPAVMRTRERMAGLIYDTLNDILTAVRDQLQVAGREEWLATQNAADLASLLDRELDGALRLLAGFRPAEPSPESDAIGAPDIVDGTSRATDDGPGFGS